MGHLEHADIVYYVRLLVHQLLLLLGLHDLYSLGLNQKLPLIINLIGLGYLIRCRLSRLLLDDSLRNQIVLDGIQGKPRVAPNRLVIAKHWLVNLLQQDSYFRITEAHHTSLKVLYRHIRHLFDLLAVQLIILIE